MKHSRHTYATSMLRAGVSLPALMKLLGHRTANMTLRYVEITQQDLQREFHLARQKPRHLLPLPPALSATDPLAADVGTVMHRLSGAMRVRPVPPAASSRGSRQVSPASAAPPGSYPLPV